jgi:hypothetical protein
MEEKQINEVFDWEGRMFKCVEDIADESCIGCDLFRLRMQCHNKELECRDWYRKDKTGVIFVLADQQS